MSTSNFYSNRTDYVFIVETSYYNDELDEKIYDEFVSENTVSNLTYKFEKVEKLCGYSFSVNHNIRLDEDLKAYPAQSIGWFYTTLDFLGRDIEVTFIPKIVSGYYEHYNLDYELNIEWEYSTYDNFTDLLNDMIKYSDINSGLIKIHSGRFLKYAQYELNRMITIIQSVFLMYSDPYNVPYRFSDGETSYSKVG